MSRLRSSAAANRPAARTAPAGGARGVYVQAPKSDIFVVLLGISLGAILLGTLLLGLVMNRYNFKTRPTALLAPLSASSIRVAQWDDPDPRVSPPVRRPC